MPSGTLRTGSVLGNPSGSEAPVVDAPINSILTAAGNIAIGGATSPQYPLVIANGGTAKQSQLQLTNGTYSGFLSAGQSQDSAILSGGAYLNASGVWTALDTTALFVNVGPSGIQFQGSSGNTIGGPAANPTHAIYTLAGGWQAQGTTTNDNAAAGYIGELVTVTTGSTALTSFAWVNLGTFNLTAGDWDIWGLCVLNGPGATTVQSVTCGLGSSTSNLSYIAAAIAFYGQTPFGYVSNPSIPIPTQPLKLTGTTTLYLNAFTTFSTSTMNAQISAYARRRR